MSVWRTISLVDKLPTAYSRALLFKSFRVWLYMPKYLIADISDNPRARQHHILIASVVNMSVAPDDVELGSSVSSKGGEKAVGFEAKKGLPATIPNAPTSLPTVGSSINRAQTFPFNFPNLKSKSPQPAVEPAQGQEPMDSHQYASSNARKQAKRTVSEPSVLRSPPNSPTRPSLTSSTASSTSHYGRHANAWLFGNFSVRKTVKSVLKGHEGKEK